MRPRDHELIDPEIAEQLDAIDATLAGDPVDPRFAELAELALLLAAARPEVPGPEFAHELDRRVQARFGRDEAVTRAGAEDAGRARAGGAVARGARAWRWRLSPALGAAATAVAGVVVGIAVVTGGGGGSTVIRDGSSAVRSAASAAPTSHGGQEATSPAKRAAPAPAIGATTTPTAGSAGASAGGVSSPASSVNRAQSITATPLTTPGPASASAPSPMVGNFFGNGVPTGSAGSTETVSPAPVPNGRKIVQSSSLQLAAPARRIDAVAQEVFTVVGNVSGIVDSSNIASTGGPDANAQFRLRIPSPSLQAALSALSRLHYANVIARIDNTRDINSSFVSAQRQIAASQSALASLRVKLAAATIDTQIRSLRAQIANENATLAQAQAALGSVNRQVDYSRVDVSIQAGAGTPVPVTGGGSGGFGLHQAGHDALRVLEVSAGVALIVLAVLLPVGLLAALGWWAGAAVQRRRREKALDLA